MPSSRARQLIASLGACAAATLAPGSARAAAADVLFAPYVRLDGDAPVILAVTDEEAHGALVRVQLFDTGGHPIRYGEHAITISRAVPPGETIRIDLSRFGSDVSEGSVQLSASRAVSATLAAPGLSYALVPGRAGEVRLAVGSGAVGRVVVGVMAAGGTPAEARVLRRLGDDDREIGRLRVDPFASRLWEAPEEVSGGAVLVLRADAPVAAVLFLRDARGRLRSPSPVGE